MLKTKKHPGSVLITGADGFTGKYLTAHLLDNGFSVHALASDLLDNDSLVQELEQVSPDYVIHLAAISFVAEKNSEKIYQVNVLGTELLLKSLAKLKNKPKKIILASSAAVYGNQDCNVLDEGLCPRPVSHYAFSKLNMELLSATFANRLDILNVRLFNYTGIGQDDIFIIPKLVAAFKRGDKYIELGNIDVKREFNDVRDVCEIYTQLLTSPKGIGVVNICSSRSISLSHVIKTLNNLSGYEIDVRLNQEFVRENEVWDLSGSITNLSSLIDLNFHYSIEETLEWMFVE